MDRHDVENAGGEVDRPEKEAPRKVKAAARRLLGASVEKASKILGRRYLRRLGAPSEALSDSFAALPKRMHRTANEVGLVLELLGDFKSGAYRALPWHSVFVLAAAVLYSVNPADVIPNAIPLLGTLDDIAVVAFAVRLIERDLRAYCRFKGYREEDYVDGSRDPPS